VLDVPTICYGHTGPDVKFGDRKTPDECMALLEGDVAEAN
jgi:lysozyme